MERNRNQMGKNNETPSALKTEKANGDAGKSKERITERKSSIKLSKAEEREGLEFMNMKFLDNRNARSERNGSHSAE